jgi:hypothetical protein
MKRMIFSAFALLATHLAVQTTHAATRAVPTQYATIQAAVDAARPGDLIRVLPGTYVGQVSIGKNLRIVGSGSGKTFIRAPGVLGSGALGFTSIFEVRGGASVELSHVTVRGPGAGTCEAGSLRAGISVVEDATLDVSFVDVTRIHDTPKHDCFPNGVPIRIGDRATGSLGHASIRYSRISDFQGVGILVFGGSSALISHNIITGAGPSPVVVNTGIDIRPGGEAAITDNVVSGNVCAMEDAGCGPNPLTDIQNGAIFADGPGVLISRNLLFDNDVGIYVSSNVAVGNNVMLNNILYGILVQDGEFTLNRDFIWGGLGGVGVVAFSADTHATLNRVKIFGNSGKPVQLFECCEVEATATTIR